MMKKMVIVSIVLIFMFSIFSNFSLNQAEAQGNEGQIKNESSKSIEQTNNLTTENSQDAVPVNIYNKGEEKEKEDKLSEPRKGIHPHTITSGSLMEYPGIIKINETTGESTGKVSGAYANILMFSAQSKYTVVGAKSTTTSKTVFSEATTEATGGEHYVKISNVGFYQGKKIDVKINLESIDGVGQFTVWTPTKVGDRDFLRMQVKGKDRLLKIRYDFLDNETGKKVPYKGSWIIKRLNDYKTLRINSTPEYLNGIFAYDTKDIINYSTENNFATSDFVGTNASIGIELKKNQMMYSFNAPNGSAVQEYFPRGVGDRNVYYEPESIVQMELPYPSLFGLTNEAHPKVSYDIQQDYPAQSETKFYPTSYEVTAQLDKVVDMSKLSLKVTDLSGTDVTSKFTMTKMSDSHIVKININAANLNSEAFANNSYKMHLESEMASSVSPDEYYQEDGYYHIPAKIKMKSSLNESPEQTDEALTKAPLKGTVTAKYVLEDEKTEIADAITQTDIVGKDYAIEQKKIEGYEFVKAVGNTSGKYTEAAQTTLMVYKKIEAAKGTVTAKYVLEDEKTAITDAVTQTGEVGKPYTIEQKKIEGYEFVKSIGDTTGKYTENAQTVLMIYKEVKKNIAPIITLDQESSEPVNNIGEDYTISGKVTDEDSDEVSVYYKFDSGTAVKLETFKQPEDKNKPFDYTAVIAKDVLNDGKEHTIEVFAVDSDEVNSKETPKVTLAPFTGALEFVAAPEDISFGENLAISTKLKNYFVQEKTNDLIVQDKRVVPGTWRMSASLEKALTSDSGAKIGDAVRYGDQVISVGQSTSIFDQQQPHKDEINLSHEWIEKKQGLNLSIPAGKVKAENYSTEIVWSLESVPENE